MSIPSLWHQRIAGSLYNQLCQFLDGKPCEPFMAPVEVRLFPHEDESDDTVVQPDVFVVCNKSKLNDGKVCLGAPDFAAEVVTPGSTMVDKVKKDLYCKADVKEYWMITLKKIFVYVLADGMYNETVYEINSSSVQNIPMSALPGCIIKLKP